MKLFTLICSVFLLFACETVDFEESDFSGTWNFEWKRCDNFYLSEFGDIFFAFSDTSENVGVVKEIHADTTRLIYFRFSFVGTEQLVIDSLYNPLDTTAWLGTHQITELQKGSFLLERTSKTCDDELFRLTK